MKASPIKIQPLTHKKHLLNQTNITPNVLLLHAATTRRGTPFLRHLPTQIVLVKLELQLKQLGDRLNKTEANVLIVHAQTLAQKVDDTCRELQGTRRTGAHVGQVLVRQVLGQLELLRQVTGQLVDLDLAVLLAVGAATRAQLRRVVELALGALEGGVDEDVVLLADRPLQDGAELCLEEEGEVEVVLAGELPGLGEDQLAVVDGQVEVAT